MSDQEKLATCISIRACVDSIVEIMGENGAKVIFRAAGHPEFSDQPPPYTWDPCITLGQQAELYNQVAGVVGVNGAVGIWRRIGYAAFRYADEQGHGLSHLDGLSPDEQFRKGLELYSAASGRGRVVENGSGRVDFDVFDCSICRPYKTDRPICTAFGGVVQYMADRAYGKGAFLAQETQCMAKGDGTCYFVLEPCQ
jgi:predicted hydrocarbon binding protein